jgi:transposase
MKQDAPITAVNATSLPEDPAILKRMIQELLTQLRDQKNELAGVQNRLDQLLRRLYGPKGEKFNPHQPTLFDDLPATDTPVSPVAEPEKPVEMKKLKGHGRRGLPKNLKRQTVIHDLPEAEKPCPCCQQQRVKVGEDSSEKLDYIPSSLFIVDHVRFKYACPKCLKNQIESNIEQPLIAAAPMPPSVIDKGIAEPGLLAHVIVSKYMDHLPLHRLEGMFQRQGVPIPRSTLCDWMAACAAALTPLYRFMLAEVLQSKVIHTDETRVPVQDTGQTRSGRLWVYVGDRDHPYTIYDYRIDKSRDGPAEILKEYKGFLHADAANVFDGIYRPGAITEVGCWAHARRHFHDCRTSDTAVSAEAMARIGALYAVEREATEVIERDGLTSDAADTRRLQYRRDKSVSLLASLKTWVDATVASTLPKSPITQALAYVQRHWQALNRYTEQGYLNIDNNAAERGFRPIAVGRKNWLFAGSDAGGKTAAVLFSITQTCRDHKIDPWAYLRDILTRLPLLGNQPTPDQLRNLTPTAWQQSRP